MLKKVICCAFIALSPGWLSAISMGSSLLPADMLQSQPAINSAQRDEAIAEVKKRIAGHEDEPAEKVFKNIEILRGKKASRLPGMMSALTGLLGVNCTYCHVKGNWDSEEMPAKQTARKMFKMMGAINNDYFDGKNAVSCWTCHRGTPRPPIQQG